MKPATGAFLARWTRRIAAPTRPSRRMGRFLPVGNTSASTLWFQKSGGEVVKAKLGGTLSSAALYTKDGRLDESTGDADGLYALVKASDSSSAYFITLDGDREKIVSDIRAFQIANGKICYLTTDKDLYLADIDGGAGNRRRRSCGRGG